MADLSTVFPQMAQSEGFQSGLWQADQNALAQQNAKLNQQGALQQMFREQQMLPLDMANKQATTNQANANAYHQQGLGANSFYDLDAKERLKEPTYLKALSTLAADTSENEVKQMHASLEKDMLSTDPTVRDAAQSRYKVSGDMLKMYEDNRIKTEGQVKVAETHNQGTLGAARIAADSHLAGINAEIEGGKYNKNSSWYAEMNAMKSPQGAISVWEQRKNIAAWAYNQETDPARKAEAKTAYDLATASEATARQQAAIAATAGAGVNAQKSADLNAMGGGHGLQGIPVPQAPQPVQQLGGPQKAPTNVQEAQQAGWTLHVDKNGNKAYVGPGNQYIEVK